jgi:hypothetical protein
VKTSGRQPDGHVIFFLVLFFHHYTHCLLACFLAHYYGVWHTTSATDGFSCLRMDTVIPRGGLDYFFFPGPSLYFLLLVDEFCCTKHGDSR